MKRVIVGAIASLALVPVAACDFAGDAECSTDPRTRVTICDGTATAGPLPPPVTPPPVTPPPATTPPVTTPPVTTPPVTTPPVTTPPVTTPPVTTPPVPPVDPVPVGPRTLFVGDYDTGDLSQWGTCQWVGYNSDCADADPDARSARVLDGGPGHPTAARFEVRDGDAPPFGGGERAEVSANGIAGPTVREGDERWYRFSLRFDSTFRDPVGDWFILMQWHAGSGSPPLALTVSRDGVLQLTNDRGEAPTRDIGPIRRGTWTDYVLRVRFSNDSRVGFAEVHEDGRLVLPRHARRTLASSQSYLKQGIYRDGDERQTAVVWWDDLVVTGP